MITDAINLLSQGIHLTEKQATGVFEEIMTGEATPAQIGAYLIAQKMTGETVAEITGAARVMRAKATKIPFSAKDAVDTCGTGGDSSGTFNISTTSAFVVAGAGIPVAKHGNRSISSKCGSADVLMNLGVNLDITAQEAGECIDEIGLGFLFAPKLHGAMKYAIGPRKEIGLRSIFNCLGPLTNPAETERQVIGVFSKDLTQPLASVLGNLGAKHVWVVHGLDGLDEISLTKTTQVAEFKNGILNEFTFDPQEFGFEYCTMESLQGESAQENALILKAILDGEKSPRRDIVLLNAAAAILVSGKVTDFKAGLQLATESIDSGKALGVLNQLIAKTQGFTK